MKDIKEEFDKTWKFWEKKTNKIEILEVKRSISHKTQLTVCPVGRIKLKTKYPGLEKECSLVQTCR
jgi:hypothetical protein